MVWGMGETDSTRGVYIMPIKTVTQTATTTEEFFGKRVEFQSMLQRKREMKARG